MMRERIIRMLGGYATADEAIDSIRDSVDQKARQRVLTLAVKGLFNTIGPDDILREEDGRWRHGGRHLTDAERKILIAEAQQFAGTALWKVLQDDVKWQANRKMFILAKDDMDITAGKLWTYTFDALRTRIESMAKGSGIFNNGK